MPHVRTHQKQTCLSKLYTQSIQRGEKTRIGWYWWALPASCWRLPFRFFMISMPRFRDCGRKHIQTTSIQVCGRIMQRFKECIKTGMFRFHPFMRRLQIFYRSFNVWGIVFECSTHAIFRVVSLTWQGMCYSGSSWWCFCREELSLWCTSLCIYFIVTVSPVAHNALLCADKTAVIFWSHHHSHGIPHSVDCIPWFITQNFFRCTTINRWGQTTNWKSSTFMYRQIYIHTDKQ